jgi:hypothetical protein
MPIPFHPERINSAKGKPKITLQENKNENELKSLLRSVKYHNINETVEEVLKNFLGKEETKLQMATNKDSIIHNELLKNKFIGEKSMKKILHQLMVKLIIMIKKLRMSIKIRHYQVNIKISIIFTANIIRTNFLIKFMIILYFKSKNQSLITNLRKM